MMDFDLLGLFLLGVFAHQVMKWSTWKMDDGTALGLRSYAKANGRPLIGALAGDLVLIALYVTGGAEVVVRYLVAWANPELAANVDRAFMHIVAPLAGWVSDSIGRNLLTAFSRMVGENVGADTGGGD